MYVDVQNGEYNNQKWWLVELECALQGLAGTFSEYVPFDGKKSRTYMSVCV